MALLEQALAKQMSPANDDNTDNANNAQAPSVISAAKAKCALPSCRRKLAITRTPCACGKVFCPRHAFFADHGCDVDYQKRERELSRAASPSSGRAYKGTERPDGGSAY